MRATMLALLLLTTLGGAAAAQPLLGGFVEGVTVLRVEANAALDGGRDLTERAYPRSELRGQLTLEDGLDDADVFLRLDLISDAVGQEPSRMELREAYLKVKLAAWLDLKAGRQVATWGTGDLIFANDLFAKDWEAFFTGLDDAYLKPPQDLLRLSAYLGAVTAELALSPAFTPDRLPAAGRLSSYDPFLGEAVASGASPAIVTPGGGLENGELFARLSGSRGSAEWALYGYKGFWPTPQAVLLPADAEAAPALAYPRMASAGASLRGPLGAWLVSLEGALYASEQDAAGDDPLQPNSELRLIGGLEKSLGGDWMLGAQWYGIRMLDYAGYEAGLAPGAPVFAQQRQYLTGRLTKLALDQKLALSLFGYYSATDEDWHLRPSLAYELSAAVKATLGASLLGGEDPWTQFGQFADNSNVYLRLRYSF